jgi:hypothetical protein
MQIRGINNADRKVVKTGKDGDKGMKGFRACGAVCLGLVLTAALSPTLAQEKELSDQSVISMMEWAFALTPQKFTHPNGEVIIVDKTKKNEVMIPVDKAREIIRVGYLSAKAQYCDMAEEQNANYQTMMKRERLSGKWTRQQYLFISQLHLYTVMRLTGKTKETMTPDGQRQVEVVHEEPMWSEPCTDEHRKKIAAQIAAYVNAPLPAQAAAATSTEAQPAPASLQQMKRVEPAQTAKKK